MTPAVVVCPADVDGYSSGVDRVVTEKVVSELKLCSQRCAPSRG
jgi:hypothetical protein